MATIEKRNNAYRITVCCGYDINGKQIRRRMTYTPEKGMTAKQIDMFSDKLSKLESFQSHYIADAGVSVTEYKQAIAAKLQDQFYVEAWGKYLADVGFTKKVLLDK